MLYPKLCCNKLFYKEVCEYFVVLNICFDIMSYCRTAVWLYSAWFLNNQKVTLKSIKETMDTTSCWVHHHLTLALLNEDRHCLCKQYRSRSDGFCRSHLIRIYTVCYSVCEFIWTNNIELSDRLTVRIEIGKRNLFSWIRFWLRSL